MKALLLVGFIATTLSVASAEEAAPPPAQATAEGRVAFRVRAPKANEVLLRGQWTREAIPLARGEKDDWSVTIEKIPAGVWEYSFAVDGMNVLDALNPAFKPQRELQKSITHIPSTPLAPWARP